jgi:hypothetical protein
MLKLRVVYVLKSFKLFFILYIFVLGCLDSDWLKAGRPRGRILSPGKNKVLFCTESKLVQGPHLASYRMGTACFFPGSKSVRA